jgi:hypothetical protein
VVLLELSAGGVAADFRPVRGVAAARMRSHLAEVLETTPPDAVGAPRQGDLPPGALSGKPPSASSAAAPRAWAAPPRGGWPGPRPRRDVDGAPPSGARVGGGGVPQRVPGAGPGRRTTATRSFASASWNRQAPRNRSELPVGTAFPYGRIRTHERCLALAASARASRELDLAARAWLGPADRPPCPQVRAEGAAGQRVAGAGLSVNSCSTIGRSTRSRSTSWSTTPPHSEACS